MLQIVFQAKIGLILKQPAVFRLKLAVVQNADALRNRKLLCFPIRNGRNPARVLQICFFLFHLIFLFRGSAFFGRSRAVFLSKLSKKSGHADGRSSGCAAFFSAAPGSVRYHRSGSRCYGWGKRGVQHHVVPAVIPAEKKISQDTFPHHADALHDALRGRVFHTALGLNPVEADLPNR